MRAGGHLAEVARVFGSLGWRAFGGPAVHVALMKREVVDRRRWLTADDFASLYAACNLLPGPGSTQLALLLGLRRAGAWGMAIAACLFIGPAAALMLALGELYSHVGTNRIVVAVLLGVDSAVVGLVVAAVAQLSKLADRRWENVAIAVGAIAAGLVRVNPVIVLGLAGVFRVICLCVSREQPPSPVPGKGAPLLLFNVAPIQLATGTGLLPLALTFLKIGAIAFGSGYVLLPFLQADLVGGQFGLTDRQVLDAFAISQATPGPVFGMAAFLGVQTAGVAGGLVAVSAIFAPSLVCVPLVDVIVRELRDRRLVRAALDGVIAGSLGLIIAACLTLGRVALVGPIEWVVAVAVIALLWKRPTAQPLAIVLGVMAGGLIAVGAR